MAEISSEDFKYLFELKMAYSLKRYLECDKSRRALVREQLNIFYSRDDIDEEIRNQALRNVIDELEP